jgi:hypothetical protein
VRDACPMPMLVALLASEHQTQAGNCFPPYFPQARLVTDAAAKGTMRPQMPALEQSCASMAPQL